MPSFTYFYQWCSNPSFFRQNNAALALNYNLIYSDDVLHDHMNVKREIMYCKPQIDGDNAYYEIDSDKMDNEYFKQNLRTNKGIFFNLNVTPASPRKLRSP